MKRRKTEEIEETNLCLPRQGTERASQKPTLHFLECYQVHRMPVETAAETELTPPLYIVHWVHNQTFLIFRLTSSGESKRSILDSCIVMAKSTVTRESLKSIP